MQVCTYYWIIRFAIKSKGSWTYLPDRTFSNLIDILQKSFLVHDESYAKDNLHFLSKYSRETYEDNLLVTLDVVNLYTNIPHTSGLEALDY